MDSSSSFKTLSYDDARGVYNLIGAGQDTQAFYEDVATGKVIAHGDFASAESVFEFGCGTGRFGRMLLAEHLPETATYRGVDLSTTMIELAKNKVAEFGGRAEIALSEGGPPSYEPRAAFDRFVSNYVFDLLSEADIAAVISEAHRMLRSGGLLCLSSLSSGHGLISNAVISVWSFLHYLNPRLVAGCRPIEILPFLNDELWEVHYHEAVTPFGLPSEVVVAERL